MAVDLAAPNHLAFFGNPIASHVHWCAHLSPELNAPRRRQPFVQMVQQLFAFIVIKDTVSIRAALDHRGDQVRAAFALLIARRGDCTAVGRCCRLRVHNGHPKSGSGVRG